MSSSTFIFHLLEQAWYYRKLWFVTSFGIAFILLAYIFAYEVLYLQYYGIKAEAVVVKMIEKEAVFEDEDGTQDTKILLTPVVRYTDNNNQQQTVKSKSSRDRYDFKTGDTVSVYYHPKDTRRMVVDGGFTVNYVAGALFSVLGLLALIPLFRHIFFVGRNLMCKVTQA